MNRILYAIPFGLLIFFMVFTLSGGKFKQHRAMAVEAKFTTPKVVKIVERKIKKVENVIGIKDLIRKESSAAKINPLITLAILHQESGKGLRTDRLRYEPHLLPKVKRTPGMTEAEARMQVTSIGLLQVLPIYHLDRCTLKSYSQLFDPQTNIKCGLKVLNDCAAKYKGTDKVQRLKEALHCYNGSAKYVEEVFQRIAELTVERIG